MNKRAWKPLDVDGLRLYEVQVYPTPFNPQKHQISRFLVMADSPRDAARLVEDGGYEPREWIVTGRPITVLMPEEWWTDGVPT